VTEDQQPVPVSHLEMGKPAEPKDQWRYSFMGYKGWTLRMPPTPL
jgi:hypothetical protein